YEVPLTHPGRDRERGRIWRIHYQHATKPVSPCRDFRNAGVPELIADLAHPNLSVRFQATNQLVERGGADVIAALGSLLHESGAPAQRVHGLWVLERLHALDLASLAKAVSDPDAAVRVHALKVLTERKNLDKQQEERVIGALRDRDGFVQRAAAEALGTHPSAEHLEPLLALVHGVPADDTHLLYMVRMSLRNQLNDSKSWEKLSQTHWGDADYRSLADVAAGFPDPKAAIFLLGYLERAPEGDPERLRFLHHIGRYGSAKEADAAVLMITKPPPIPQPGQP